MFHAVKRTNKKTDNKLWFKRECATRNSRNKHMKNKIGHGESSKGRGGGVAKKCRHGFQRTCCSKWAKVGASYRKRLFIRMMSAFGQRTDFVCLQVRGDELRPTTNFVSLFCDVRQLGAKTRI